MNKSLVGDKNYIQIEGWMANKLHLVGNELIIYALVYGFSQIENHTFHGSLQYICDWTSISKNSCISNLKKLVDKKLIIKNEKEINGVKFCEYSANLNSIQETCIPIQETCIPIQETCTNILVDNKEDIIDNSILDKSNIEYGVDTKKESKKDIELKENIKCIIDYLNESTNSKFKYDNKQTIRDIKARFKEGYVLDDFYDVIDKKVKEWFNTEMEKYLRPSTLFGNKFENYINQKNNFSGKPKTSYSSKPSFDNTADHEILKGVAEMTAEERADFEQNELARDENGNLIKF